MSFQENPHNIDEGVPPTQIEDSPEANPRLLEAVREYQAAIDAGRRPNRRDFLARYADLGDELADCLDGLDFVHSAASRLTGSDAPKAAKPAAELLNPEQPLGDFRIVREIGRGGMGIVYEAVQLSLGRRVALKVLPFAATLDVRQLQRFKTEAQAAAQLHHGHIVPVFFVGSERGVHFYAMQYIEGQTLAALIADLRRQQSAGDAMGPMRPIGPIGPMSPISPIAGSEFSKESLGPGAATIASQHTTNSPAFFRTIAQLGVQAAEALEHAHQQGVVHRDIKPANLLLDQRGCLWITDFGLARVQTDAGATASGDVVGTVRYMSPEQALGKALVDQRTDVYSLGATLYELLTLMPAFDGRNRQDFMHQILECEPMPVRSHNPAIPGDLETIVLKSLAKAPEERYNSAQELADDLRRFLEDKPIQARRPSLLEKASKWSRRHRPLVGAAVALLALAVVGLAASTIVIAREQAKTQQAYNDLEREQAKTQRAYDELDREQARTKKALAAERVEQKRAMDNLQKARRVLDLFTQIAENDPADRPGLEANRLKLLTASLAFYQDFREVYRDDKEATEELTKICLHLANLLNDLGARADAIAMWEQARRIQETVRPPERPGGPPDRPGPGGPRGGPGPPPGPDGFSPVILLGQTSVQQYVGLSADQVNQVNEVRKLVPKPLPRRGDKGMAEMARLEKKLTELLNPDQARRLQQLIWQQRGTHALGDAEVAEGLQLTHEQREKIRTIQNEAREQRFSRDMGWPRGPEADRRADDFWKSINEKTLLVLTPEQRNKWKAMMGEPFRGDVKLGPS